MSDTFLLFLFCYSMYLSVLFKLQEKKSSKGGYCWDMGDAGCGMRDALLARQQLIIFIMVTMIVSS